MSNRSCRAGAASRSPRRRRPACRSIAAWPVLLSHVLVGKYCDHLPLHRQAEIYAREGVELDRSTMADWVGQSARLMRPLVEAVGLHVIRPSGCMPTIHTRPPRLAKIAATARDGSIAGRTTASSSSTPMWMSRSLIWTVPVLDPGRGKTKTGRLWCYARDDGPFGGKAAPAVLYCYSPDRKGEHPRAHLASFHGILQAHGYAGLYDRGVTEAACWAHARPPRSRRWRWRRCNASRHCTRLR